MSQLVPDVEKVLAALEAAQAHLAEDIKEGLNQGDRLRDAARSIGNSSSGSWIGWHSRMYYGNYVEPPVADSWNSEWGGIGHYSGLWQERSLAEVQRGIEDRAGVRLAVTAHYADRVREVCQPLQQELVAVLSPVCDLAGLANEAELLAKLEKIEWIVSPAKFVRALAPNQIWSRDTGALSQGKQAPHHLEVFAAITTNTTTLTTSREFLTDAIRLARQVKTKLKAIPAGVQVDARATAGPVDAHLHRQLRQRSLALFALVAAAVVGGDVWILQVFGHNRLITAALVVAGALAVGGAYAWLIDRARARRAILAGGGVLAAIAAVDQLLAHFLT